MQAQVMSVVSLEAIGVAAAAFLVLVALLLLPASHRRLVRRPVALLVFHAGFYALAHELPAQSRELPDAGDGKKLAAFLAVAFLLASIGRSLVLLLMHVVFEGRGARPVPRIFHDLAQGVVWVVVLMLSLHSAGVDPESLVTSGALITAAVALALQDTLGNIVAGLAMQGQRPFDVGDWIQFDDDQRHVGRVVEINWRATKIVTHEDVEIVVPNSMIAKAPITNFTKPDPVSRRAVYVSTGVSVPPHVVRDAILRALDGVTGVVRAPAPSVLTSDLADGSVQHWVRFFTDRFDLRDEVDGAVRDRIWYALARAGIAISLPSREVRLEAPPADAAATSARHEEALRAVDFLRVIPDGPRRTLAQRGHVRLYAEGETVVKQGDVSTEMYLVESGEVRVVIARDGAEQELARLGPGTFFGEMALMTGEARNASVVATSPCALFVIDHDAFKAALDAAPEAAEHVTRIIAERQAAIDVRPDEDRKSIDDRSTALLGRLKRFFSL